MISIPPRQQIPPTLRQTSMLIKLLTLFMSVFLLPSPATAKWVDIPLDELVQRADAGIIAKLTNIRKTAGWGVLYATGTLEVDSVLFGEPLPGDKIPIEWAIDLGVVASGDLSYFTTERIWLITLHDGVASVWWQDVLDPARRFEVLQATKALVRAKPLPDYSVNLIYRNLTSDTVTVPRFKITDGVVVLPPEIEFTVTDWEQAHLKANPDRLQKTPSTQTMALKPGQVFEQAVPIKTLYPLTDGHTYDFAWTVKGFGPSNKVQLTKQYPNRSAESGERYTPLWLNIGILIKYPPTREIFAAFLVLTLCLIAYMRTRNQQKSQMRSPT